MIKELTLANSKFLLHKVEGANFVFSTGENNLSLDSISIHRYKEAIKEGFSLKDIGWASQVHSDIIIDYQGKIEEGDGIYSASKAQALGIFTADCVPILIADSKQRVVAAVHSGWKGTYENIVGKMLLKLMSQYKCSREDIIIYIGPHIKSCCYEVGEELKNKFLDKGFPEEVFEGTNLSLQKCIYNQITELSIWQKNIYSLDYCTRCSTNPMFNSYRRDKEASGRNFSFVFLD